MFWLRIKLTISEILLFKVFLYFFHRKNILKVCLPTNPKNIGDIIGNKTFLFFNNIDSMCTKSISDSILGLPSFSMPYWQATSIQNFNAFTALIIRIDCYRLWLKDFIIKNSGY